MHSSRSCSLGCFVFLAELLQPDTADGLLHICYTYSCKALENQAACQVRAIAHVDTLLFPCPLCTVRCTLRVMNGLQMLQQPIETMLAGLQVISSCYFNTFGCGDKLALLPVNALIIYVYIYIHGGQSRSTLNVLHLPRLRFHHFQNTSEQR